MTESDHHQQKKELKKITPFLENADCPNGTKLCVLAAMQTGKLQLIDTEETVLCQCLWLPSDLLEKQLFLPLVTGLLQENGARRQRSPCSTYVFVVRST